jgi:diaminopimelate decarboxylase
MFLATPSRDPEGRRGGFGRLGAVPPGHVRRGVGLALSRKSGCSTYEAVEILAGADEFGLAAAGVSFHVGSQQRHPEA